MKRNARPATLKAATPSVRAIEWDDTEPKLFTSTRHAPEYFRKLIAVAERYFKVFPTQGKAIEDAHRAEAEDLERQSKIELSAVAERMTATASDDGVRWPHALIVADDDISRRARAWLLSDIPYYGGVLGAALSNTSIVPILSEDEVWQLVDAGDSEFEERPPVVVTRQPIVNAGADNFDAFVSELGVSILGFSAIPHNDMRGAVRARFDDLAVTLFENRNRVMGGFEVEEVRAAYRAFAVLFYPWAKSNASSTRAAVRGFVDLGQRLFGMVNILAGNPAEIAMNAMIDRDGWIRRPSRPPLYGDTTGSYLTAGGPPNAVLALDQEERVWNSILALDEDTLLTYVFVMFRWLAEGANEKVRIHVNDLLALRDRKRHHKGDFKSDQKREQRDKLLSLRDHWITVKDIVIEKRGKQQRKKTVNVTSQLIEIAIETEDDVAGRLQFPLGELPDALPYAFRISLGDWAKSYLGDGRRYIMPFMKTLATYDPKQGVEQKALRMALKLCFRWHSLHETGRTQQKWVVEDLLAAARIPIPTHHPDRFRTQIEEALNRLERDGVVGFWDYETGELNLPKRDWVAKWLALAVVVNPPDDVRAFYGLEPAKPLRIREPSRP